MTELSRDARSLVARARVNEGPSEADRARIRAKLQPAWTNGATDVPAATAGASRAWLRRVPIAKLLVILAAASWTPWQPSAAKPDPQPSAATAPRLAIAATPPSAASAPNEVPGAPQLASPDASSEPPAAASKYVQASGQLLARKSLNRASLQPTARSVAARRAPAPRDSVAALVDPASSLATTRVENPGAVDPTRDATPDARGPDNARAASSRAESAEPAAALTGAEAPRRSSSVALAVPLDRAAPAQTGKEFKPQAIDDELAWIGAAQEALQNHRPSQALQLVEQHSFRFPDGALTQERLVVHTLALCALERFSAARRMLAVLEERAPDAPIVARVRSSCGL